MEQIEQLKNMRDAAQDRLRANPDFKLKNSLDALIDDLEAFVSGDDSSVNTETVGSDTQDELVASDDEEEQQQSNETHLEDDLQSYNSGTNSYSDVEQAVAENTEIDSGIVENTDIEENDIAAALAQNISAEDIDSGQDTNGSDLVSSNQLDMEAEAAIEALEAELAQSDNDTRP